MEILMYGDPRLEQVCEEVSVFDNDLAELCSDLLVEMLDADGAGLAAPQCGILKRICWVSGNAEGKKRNPLYCLINPVIIKTSGRRSVWEGCLSFKQAYRVYRPESIEIEYQTVTGEKQKLKTFNKLLVQCIEHEIDHLDGKLFNREEIRVGGLPEDEWSELHKRLESRAKGQ